MSDFETVPRGTLEELEAVKAERDALTAHVEQGRDAMMGALRALGAAGYGESAQASALKRLLGETPTTSLARLKAQWQAEALEQHADYLLDHGQGVARLWAQEHANELRRQAEDDQ